MMKQLMIAVLIASVPTVGFCSDGQVPLSEEVQLELAALPNNTGATFANSSSTADIVEDEGASVIGTQDGEITLFRTSAGIDVYSGLNKVESIPDGSDGWVGRVVDNSSTINFTPAGRPQLNCPSQAISNWFGPCKVQENN